MRLSLSSSFSVLPNRSWRPWFNVIQLVILYGVRAIHNMLTIAWNHFDFKSHNGPYFSVLYFESEIFLKTLKHSLDTLFKRYRLVGVGNTVDSDINILVHPVVLDPIPQWTRMRANAEFSKWCHFSEKNPMKTFSLDCQSFSF